MACQSLNSIFGQTTLTGVQWTIQHSPDDLSVTGVIGTINENEEVVPTDITGCEINIPITDPNTGDLILNLSSEGIDPAITIYDGDVNPNFYIFLENSELISYFPETGSFPCKFIFTDATGLVTTYWIGVLNIV